MVVKNTESEKIRDLVVGVEEYLAKYRYTINTDYYLRNMLNQPLSRFLSTFDVNIFAWFDTMSTKSLKTNPLSLGRTIFGGKSVYDQSGTILNNKNLMALNKQKVCMICSKKSRDSNLCEKCVQDFRATVFLLESKKRLNMEKYMKMSFACRTCAKNYINPVVIEDIECVNWDCAFNYSKKTALDRGCQEDTLISKTLDSLVAANEFQANTHS